MSLTLPLLTLQMVTTFVADVELQHIELQPTLLHSINVSQPTEGTTDTAQETTTSSQAWGSEGTWRWGIHGGYAEDVKDDENDLTLLGVEFDYFIADELSLDLGFNVVDFTQTGGDTDGFNFTLQLRWHAIAEEDWSFFIEGGAGVLFTRDNVPIDGSDFNFTPQAGLGFSFDAGDSSRWLIGLRWHHISNANTHRTNPGRDSLMLWAGMTFPF